MKQETKYDCVLYAFAHLLDIKPSILRDLIPHPGGRKGYLIEEFYPFCLSGGFTPLRVPVKTSSTDYPLEDFYCTYWMELYDEPRNPALLLVCNAISGGWHCLAKTENGIFDPRDGEYYDRIPSHFNLEEIVFLKQDYNNMTTGEWR